MYTASPKSTKSPQNNKQFREWSCLQTEQLRTIFSAKIHQTVSRQAAVSQFHSPRFTPNA